MKKQIFKQYNQGEILLFPSRLDENIGENHLVRVIDRVVNSMDISDLIDTYEGGGTSSYHPRMLLKVLLYAYCLKIYTGRKIASALRSDITFMWLSGKQYPDFRTVNGFRSGRLKESISAIFKSMLLFMFEEGYIRMEEYYCDGTTLQADANKHKVTWKKNLETMKDKLTARIEATLEDIDRLNREEDAYFGDKDLSINGEPDSGRKERIEEKVKELNLIANANKATEKRKLLHKLQTEVETDKIQVKVYSSKFQRCYLFQTSS
jgi:transposase